MKKQLLIGTALFAAMGMFAQSGKVKVKPTGVVDMADRLARKYAVVNNPHEPVSAGKAAPSQNNETVITEQMEVLNGVSAVASPTVQWKYITGMANIYGALVSAQKTLQYNDQLNAVSWVHRKSSGANVVTSPANNSGSIIMHLSLNWGTSWDSTCIWSNSTNFGRYPQGGIYNPPGNTNINNAYGVVTGPLTGGSGWLGNFYASKQLGAANYNYTASAVPNAQQFVPNTPPFGGMAKHDFSRLSFSSTDDGVVRSLATRYFAGGTSPTDPRGAAIIKGTFNAGVFNWTSDTIMPNLITKGDGTKQFWGQPAMAWNEAGTVGYVVCIGALATATGNNLGWQPIIYKTTNSGASWSQLSGINFNSPTYSTVLNGIPSINTNSNITAPFVAIGEGYDVTVDANNRLHMVMMFWGTYSQHPDSLAFTFSFGTEQYNFAHVPGVRPYVYDFWGDGSTAWNFNTIDSLSSEGPGDTPTAGGYNDNPWDADPNSQNKVSSDSRLQVTRTSDGQYIVYSWAESDTNFTTGAKKWNSLPNIKARAAFAGTPGNIVVSPSEINVTKPTPVAVPPTYTSNPQIANRASFHFASTKGAVTSCNNGVLKINVPFVVNNSNPYSQLTENKSWYTTATLDFSLATVCTGIQQNLAYNVNNIDVYPNPVIGKATVAINLTENAPVTVEVYNIVGQLVQSVSGNGQIGENAFNLNVEGVTKGVYIVKVKAGNSTSTKKIIVE